MEFLGRDEREWILAVTTAICAVVGWMWAVSTMRYARDEDGSPGWPLSWRWVASVREVILALFFTLVTSFFIFRWYDWRYYAASLTMVAAMKLWVARRWMILDFPLDREENRLSGRHLVSVTDRIVLIIAIFTLGVLLGVFLS